LLALEHGQSPFFKSEVIDGAIVTDAGAGFQLLQRLAEDALGSSRVRDSVRCLAAGHAR